MQGNERAGFPGGQSREDRRSRVIEGESGIVKKQRKLLEWFGEL